MYYHAVGVTSRPTIFLKWNMYVRTPNTSESSRSRTQGMKYQKYAAAVGTEN